MPDDPTTNPQPTIGEQFGLGVHWAPGAPLGWRWARLQGPGVPPLHVLVVHTLAGTVGLSFQANELAEFIRQAQQESTGLVLPTNNSNGVIP